VATLQADIGKALERLGQLQTRWKDRRAGSSRWPSAHASFAAQTVARLFASVSIAAADSHFAGSDENGLPRLHYELDSAAQQDLEKTYLGKNILITDREGWDDARHH